MADKSNKNISGKKQAPKQKKPNFFVATFGELKQVSWPTFGETMKRLGAVLAITVIFLVVLMAIDFLLQWIHAALFSIEGDQRYLDGAQIAALIVAGVLVIAAVAGVVAYKVVKSRRDADDRR